jgi:hypothetical protein
MEPKFRAYIWTFYVCTQSFDKKRTFFVAFIKDIF